MVDRWTVTRRQACPSCAQLITVSYRPVQTASSAIKAALRCPHCSQTITIDLPGTLWKVSKPESSSAGS